MSALIRPKPGEDEEDLLRQEEEFFKLSSLPSANVNKRKAEQRNASKFAKTSRKRNSSNVPSALESVLGDIKEKIPEFTNWTFVQPNENKGFPEVFVTNDTTHEKGSSIFSQQLSVPSCENVESGHLDAFGAKEDVSNAFGDESYILRGNDAAEIHKENVKKLSEMSVSEICAEQKKLKEQLDPKVLEFLLSRRKHNACMGKVVDRTQNNSSENQFSECKNEERQNPPDYTVQALDKDNKWLHMDVVEEEKLHWVGDIPPAQPIDAHQQYNARFDFQGMLMPYVSEEIDVRKALYHHGNEPQRPGYSLEELYQLSRSSVLQQRVIALNTIGNILDKVKKGYYDVCFSEELLHQLLDHEIFLLIRFALDENTETQLAAALFAMRNLLCSEVDELCLERAMGCWKGIWQPNLFVVHNNIPQNKEQELKETESELKDFEMLKVDIIKGALRTDIVPRIRYILEVLRPGPKAVISCLEILARLARHSLDTSLAISCCPRLLHIIITNFVPKNWSMIVGSGVPKDMESVYNVPLVEALKLLRILACHSRKLASDLVHKYSIMDSVTSYISIDPRECSLPLREVLRLSLESFYLWQTLLAYNLATSNFIDMQPVLIRLLQFHYHATSIEEDGSSFSYEHGTALISLIEQGISVAHSESINKHTTTRTLKYHHVKDFCRLLEMCLSKWLIQLASATDFTFCGMKLVGATFNCLSSLFSFQVSQAEFDIVTWLNNLENFFELKLLPFLKSQGFKKVNTVLQGSSCLLFTREIGAKRDPSALPSLGALMWKGECLTPVLHPKSPVPLVTGLLNFLFVCYNAHKGLDSKYVNIVMEDAAFVSYINCVIKEASAKLASHWFTRLEVRCLNFFLKLACLKGIHVDIVHQLAFKLVTLIQKDEKCLVHDIMSKVVFNSEFFKNSSAICEKMEALQIDSFVTKSKSNENLILTSCQVLPALWDCYKKCLNLDKGESVEDYSKLINLTATKQGTDLLLPVDWAYLPIVHIHNQEKSEGRGNEESASLVITALKWIFLLEELRPDVADSMDITDKFCRLSTVFLCASDLFLDPVIHELLHACLRRLMHNYRKIKFPPSFYDLYTQLLEQFAAVSYGDSLFGQFILVPLQQRHSAELRKQVWSEHAAVLRILSTPVNQLLFPVNEMLEPCETDRSLLLIYLQCLATGTIRENWSPVLYLVAVHHVASFINLHSETELAQHIKNLILKLGNKELQSLLINYQKPIHDMR